MFLTEKEGFNKSQVEEKINSLTSEIEYLKYALEEKDKLNLGLATALEKTRHIEASTKSLQELKMQKVLILYKTFSQSLNTVFLLYPQIEEFDELKKSFQKFSKALENCFNEEDSKSLGQASLSENDTIKLLLSKMSSNSIQPPSKPKPKTFTIKRKDSPKPKHDSLQISRAIENLMQDSTGFDSPAEKFLQTGKTENNAYTKILNHKRPNDLYPEPNESGFDLKEAVNPKDDLSEIMKAFDLD